MFFSKKNILRFDFGEPFELLVFRIQILRAQRLETKEDIFIIIKKKFSLNTET